MAEILLKQRTVTLINVDLNRNICGLKTATILIQERYRAL